MATTSETANTSTEPSEAEEIAERQSQCDAANMYVRHQVEAFLVKLHSRMVSEFHGWGLTSACWREDLAEDPIGEVTRQVIACMSGDVC